MKCKNCGGEIYYSVHDTVYLHVNTRPDHPMGTKNYDNGYWCNGEYMGTAAAPAPEELKVPEQYARVNLAEGKMYGIIVYPCSETGGLFMLKERYIRNTVEMEGKTMLIPEWRIKTIELLTKEDAVVLMSEFPF